MDEAVRQARYRCCARCRYEVTQSPSVRGNRWSMYCAHDADSPDHFRGPGGWRERNPEFMTGPASNCPIDAWNELPPVDVEAELAKGRERMIKRQTLVYGSALGIALEGRPEQEVNDLLEQMVSAGILLPEAAAELALEIH